MSKEDVEREFKNEIIRLYNKKKSIPEIADILRISAVDVSRTLSNNKDLLLKKKEERGIFEKDKTIKTKDTLKDLHEATLKIVEDARTTGDYSLALQAIKEAREQTKITMQSKGEFDTNKIKDDTIPKDFAEFLVKQMKIQGIIKIKEKEKKEEEEKK